MSQADDYQKDVAGNFLQTIRNITFDLTKRWFPERAAEFNETAERRVEEDGLLVEGIEVIRLWFRSDADAKWLEQFRQSPEGRRFLELNAELMMRATFREHHPEVPVPPPSKS
jgi:hypothetical protein